MRVAYSTLQRPISAAGRSPLKRCRHMLLAGMLLVSCAAALGLLAPPRQALAQNSCSASCRAVYGNCYKRSQNREQCQQQWQRCLEQCRRSNSR